MKIKIENYDVVKYYQDGICKKSKLLKHFGSACRVLNSDLTISIIPLSWIQKIKKRTHLPFEECIVTKHAIERASERFLVKNHKLVGGLLIGTSGLILLILSWYLAVKLDKIKRERMILLIILFVGAVIYFSFLEQQFISLNLFADRMVDRHLFNWEIKAGQFLFLNSFFIVLLAPLFAILWVAMNRKKIEPNLPAKFGWGIIQAGIGFGCLIIGMKIAGAEACRSLFERSIVVERNAARPVQKAH